MLRDKNQIRFKNKKNKKNERTLQTVKVIFPSLFDKNKYIYNMRV